VAHEDSDWITVLVRNDGTGQLMDIGKKFPAKTPMCILFA
jgi:6-phosphogluconolactonase (cycloisomerase 2 family)